MAKWLGPGVLTIPGKDGKQEIVKPGETFEKDRIPQERFNKLVNKNFIDAPKKISVKSSGVK